MTARLLDPWSASDPAFVVSGEEKSFGASLFMHYSLAGDPGLPENIYQYGFWGSIIGVLEDPSVCGPNLPTLTGNETIASVVHHCPKYRALAEQVP